MIRATFTDEVVTTPELKYSFGYFCSTELKFYLF